jgi:hypothetical protein
VRRIEYVHSGEFFSPHSSEQEWFGPPGVS